MSALTVRKIPPSVHAALKQRAQQNGRSTEAEVRAILEASLQPEQLVGMGTALTAIGQAVGGVELELGHAPSPARFAVFD